MERQKIIAARRTIQSIYERCCAILQLGQELSSSVTRNTANKTVFRLRVYGQRLATGYQTVEESHLQALAKREYAIFRQQTCASILGKKMLQRKYLTFWLADRRQQKLRLRENALERTG